MGVLAAYSLQRGDRQAIYQQLARNARPFEAYLLCMLVPGIAFSFQAPLSPGWKGMKRWQRVVAWCKKSLKESIMGSNPMQR
jgi:hypothetical protein